VKVGITLPQFRDDAGPALDAAGRAEAAGLDGVFVFDHLWPLRQPSRPALAGLPLAAAVAAETHTIAVGTLVARVGVLPDAVLAHTLASLARIAGPRLIAGRGGGDRDSRPENLAYGAPFRSRAERLASMADVCRRLRSRGLTTWVGGASEATAAVARAEADALNLWGVGPESVAAAASVQPVTWAGQVQLADGGGESLRATLDGVAAAGATWAVVAPLGAPWPHAVELIAAAARALVD
jgi:alkanesulfonate monooxygenase SsuD/methylene tetrahydromethanopterin reductase-like flavin-dependent oxidoreductase (luciferase family)